MSDSEFLAMQQENAFLLAEVSRLEAENERLKAENARHVEALCEAHAVIDGWYLTTKWMKAKDSEQGTGGDTKPMNIYYALKMADKGAIRRAIQFADTKKPGSTGQSCASGEAECLK